MAKKSKDKKKPDEDGTSPADAVRSAVEQALAATFAGAAAASTRERAQDLVEEIGSATGRVRQAIDDLRVLDDLKGLRAELETLNRRVEALEARADAKPTRASAGTRPARASAGTKPAGARATGRSAASARKDATPRKAAAAGRKPSTRSAASARKAPATEPPTDSSSGRS